MPRGRPTLDLTGQRFGKLVVRSCLGMVDGYRKWACDCDCGRRDVPIKQGNLTGGNTRSCGCVAGEKRRNKKPEAKTRPLLDLAGQRYGRLVVQAEVKRGNGCRTWLCVCDCGQRDILVKQHYLRNGTKKSCGCLLRDMMRNTKGRRSIRPSPCRPPVVDLHRAGMPVKEIAERLGLTYPWVWTILKEAKA